MMESLIMIDGKRMPPHPHPRKKVFYFCFRLDLSTDTDQNQEEKLGISGLPGLILQTIIRNSDAMDNIVENIMLNQNSNTTIISHGCNINIFDLSIGFHCYMKNEQRELWQGAVCSLS